MAKQVIVKLNKDGIMESVDVDGTVGTECKDITSSLLEKIDAPELVVDEKPEMEQEVAVGVSVDQTQSIY